MSFRFALALICGAISAPPAFSQNAPALATRGGFEAGGQVSDYRYTEPGVGVKIDGAQVGLRGAYTVPFEEVFFSRLEVRLAYGELRYSGSGTADDQPNLIFEGRYLLGRDFHPGAGVALTPYSGLAYRYLYNDLRGTSSTGAVGYRRYSQYFYLPLGLSARFRAGDAWVVSPSLEYDVFLGGNQYSKLSDAGFGDPDVRNKQRKGAGYRANLIFNRGPLSFGPWVQFWRIKDSEIVRISATTGALEPENKTREAGLEFNYHF